MPVKAKEAKRYADTPFGRMEVELVSDELIAELDAEGDLAEEQIRSGELKYISLEDFAEELGINFKR